MAGAEALQKMASWLFDFSGTNCRTNIILHAQLFFFFQTPESPPTSRAGQAHAPCDVTISTIRHASLQLRLPAWLWMRVRVVCRLSCLVQKMRMRKIYCRQAEANDDFTSTYRVQFVAGRPGSGAKWWARVARALRWWSLGVLTF